jgi:hypothetical protein
MRKAIVPLIVITWLLSACGGVQVIPAATDIPSGFIETQIAEGVSLTSFPMTQAAAETQAMQTLEAGLTAAVEVPTEEASEEAPTETLVPTNTPEPSAEPPSPTPEGATAAPTVDPSNPKASLGGADYTDNFNSKNYWQEFDIASSKMQIKDGEMHFTIKNKASSARWSVSWLEIEDYYLEVKASTPASCSGLDRYGIMFRAPDPNQGYHFGVTCNGKYILTRWDGSNWVVLVNYTDSDKVNTGGNTSNLLGVYVVGDQIKLYVNDTQVASLTDGFFDGEYRYGLWAASADTDNFTVRFDNMNWWNVP